MSDDSGLSIRMDIRAFFKKEDLEKALEELEDTVTNQFMKIAKAYSEAIKPIEDAKHSETDSQPKENLSFEAGNYKRDREKYRAKQDEKEEKEEKESSAKEYGGFAGNRFNKLAQVLNFLHNYDSNDEEDRQQGQKYVVKAMHQSADIIKAGLKAGFDIVGDIYDRMKAASPLLQAIESLFNIAMQLFFLPLGNKLAEVLIPGVLELLDNVVMLWDSFEGKTLPEMFEYAFSYGVGLFGRFFTDIGDKLIEQGGLLGGIGTSINMLGEFIQGPGVTVLTNILKIINAVLANLKYFIGAWVSLKAIEFTMEAANAFGFLSGKSVTATAGVLAAVGLGAGLATVGGLSAIGMAEGGYVEPREGGTLRVLAEAGEGEYIVPESKVQTFINTHQASNSTDLVHSVRSQSVSSSNTVKSESKSPVYITYNINGYTDSELKNIILDTVMEQVLKAAYKG